MNPQETQQVVTRDEKWVPFFERVKISSTNVRLETIMPQKEETFQAVIDLVKNSSCFKAFTISADVLEIFMQQFWYSIKKVQGSDSYEFLLANKKYMVNANVFRTIINICPRVEGVNFTDTKRRRTKDSKSSKKPSTTKETPKGKDPSKGSKTGKSVSVKEPVEEPIAKVVMDDAGDDVVRDNDQPQDTSEPKTSKTLNPEWFTQPLRPPTSDPEWNKRQVVLDQPEQPWFNQMVSAIKDPLTFNDLMATSIDFSSHPSYLTVAVDYFFNNGLKYLKSFDSERTYTTSITKTKVARYEIEGIEDMIPTLWSPTKVGWMKNVSVKKLHGYGHLEEIVVKRDDCQFYKFKEGVFVDLHLNDIEDMRLLDIQHKLFHLTNNDIIDFIMALRMFTRSLVIKK
ncbi:hypothetical protein Tco_0780259 [Tanacetum coccineum]